MSLVIGHSDLGIRPRRGFTLIELLVVLIIMALLMSVVTLSLKGPYQAAQLQNAAEQLQLVDRQLRDHARRTGIGSDVIVDLDKRSIEIRRHGATGNDDRDVALLGNIEVDRVLTARGRSENGRVTLRCSSLGHTPTYALRLRIGSRQSKWVMFTGITGEAMEADHENELSAAFALLAAARPDAT
jgi:type II secretion system protein H